MVLSIFNHLGIEMSSGLTDGVFFLLRFRLTFRFIQSENFFVFFLRFFIEIELLGFIEKILEVHSVFGFLILIDTSFVIKNDSHNIDNFLA